jgi:hypothetical protein
MAGLLMTRRQPLTTKLVRRAPIIDLHNGLYVTAVNGREVWILALNRASVRREVEKMANDYTRSALEG